MEGYEEQVTGDRQEENRGRDKGGCFVQLLRQEVSRLGQAVQTGKERRK